MTVDVIIPKPGMGTDEATIAKWHKAEGDRVTEGELIVEVEMAKAVEDVVAPVTGVLTKILLVEGQSAPVHTVIARIETA